jgi:broad specificity phosphatase PhoE
MKKVFFIRHGRVFNNNDYENMNYNEFMNLMLKKVDPKLCKENHGITVIPMEVDVIYPSRSLRAKDSAELIQNHLARHPKIDHSIGSLLDEVEFSETIISEREFMEQGGWEGCRKLVLERWFTGENKETFQQSLARLKALRHFLLKSEFDNILIITHGIFMRVVHLFYSNKQFTLENLLSSPRLNYGEILRESLLYPNRFAIETAAIY